MTTVSSPTTLAAILNTTLTPTDRIARKNLVQLIFTDVLCEDERDTRFLRALLAWTDRTGICIRLFGASHMWSITEITLVAHNRWKTEDYGYSIRDEASNVFTRLEIIQDLDKRPSGSFTGLKVYVTALYIGENEYQTHYVAAECQIGFILGKANLTQRNMITPDCVYERVVEEGLVLPVAAAAAVVPPAAVAAPERTLLDIWEKDLLTLPWNNADRWVYYLARLDLGSPGNSSTECNHLILRSLLTWTEVHTQTIQLWERDELFELTEECHAMLTSARYIVGLNDSAYQPEWTIRHPDSHRILINARCADSVYSVPLAPQCIPIFVTYWWMTNSEKVAWYSTPARLALIIKKGSAQNRTGEVTPQAEYRVSARLETPSPPTKQPAPRSISTTTPRTDYDCSVCFEVPAPPWYSCTGGHLLCLACHKSLAAKKCPVCRVDMITPSRNLAAEKLALKYETGLKVACGLGECAERVGLAELEAHREGCEHKPVSCSYINICTWTGSKQQLLLHLMEKHDAELLDSNTGIFSLTGKSVWLLTCDQGHVHVDGTQSLLNRHQTFAHVFTFYTNLLSAPVDFVAIAEHADSWQARANGCLGKGNARSIIAIAIPPMARVNVTLKRALETAKLKRTRDDDEAQVTTQKKKQKVDEKGV